MNEMQKTRVYNKMDFFGCIVMLIVFWFPCLWLGYVRVKPRVIGLSGKAGSGKTTLAQEMKRHYGYKELNFADPLKDMARVLGFEVDSQVEKKRIHPFWKISSRHFLQLWGTELCRRLLPDVIPQMSHIWIQCMQRRVEEFYDDYGNLTTPLVIADVRFADEAQLVHKLGGTIIRIERKDNDQGLVHESEKGIPDCLVDHVLINDGTVHDLFLQFTRCISPKG